VESKDISLYFFIIDDEYSTYKWEGKGGKKKKETKEKEMLG